MANDLKQSRKLEVVGFPDFWQHVHDSYAKSFEAAAELTSIGNEAFNVPLAEPLHKVARHIAKTVWNSFGALMVLVLNGYGPDAMKIARGMFEASVTLGYLRIHPDQVDDYIDFHAVIRKRLHDYMKQSSPDQLGRYSQNVIREIETDFARVAPRFRTKSGRLRASWAKRSLREMSKEVGQEQLYLTFYSFASSLHHSDMSGMVAQTLRTEAEDVLDVDIAPSDKWLRESLIIGHGAVVGVLREYNEITKAGLDKIVERSTQLFVDAWGHNTRNPISASGTR
jgi:hypothetical protein